MQFSEIKQKTIKTHLKISKVVDGDGLIVTNILTKEEFEIRFLGIDAPEIKPCKKLAQDERETHIASQLLMVLGKKSMKHLINLAPPETNITIAIEKNNTVDVYGRTLAYVFLADGTCLNEKMIIDGYAKPYNRFFCSELPNYQVLYISAKSQKKGLFSLINEF